MTVLGFEPDDYRVPFEEEAHQDPTLEEITRIVCHDKIRPQLAENIGKNFSSETNFEPLEELFFSRVFISYSSVENPQMGEVSRLIKECLAERPQARINTLRLRKTLAELKSSLTNG